MYSKKVQQILSKTEQEVSLLRVSHGGEEKRRRLAVIEAQNHVLTTAEVRELASSLGICYVSPPLIARTWIPSICNKYMSVKYTDPKDERHYLILITARSIFGVSGVIYHTPNGYKETSWFNTFIENLDLMYIAYHQVVGKIPPHVQGLARQDLELEAFGIQVNDKINGIFATKVMTKEQIHVVNAFFERYVPDIEGICTKCFKLGMPKKGPGIRWYANSLNNCEIRLSEEKPFGQTGQQKTYVTQIYEINSKKLHVKWDGFSPQPSLVELKRGVAKSDDFLYSHLCWKSYDYGTITKLLQNFTNIPVCQCPILI
ncbi:MAG: hypothetical protein LLG04_15600 [Parachlamydia sp.]|nr:hypothetical protein [Parachlamydia sp.]